MDLAILCCAGSPRVAWGEEQQEQGKGGGEGGDLIRKRVYEIIEKAKRGDRYSKVFDIFISCLIITNILAVILETVKSIEPPLHRFFTIFELISVIIFTIEYIIRAWTCVESEKYKNAISGRIKYTFSFMALIDLVAILPFYLPFLQGIDLRFVRVLRLFRLFKLGRYSKAMITIQEVFKNKKEELTISLVLVSILLVLSSSMMYYAENRVQPEAFSSIPATFWWSVVTLSTVGYGDVYPITTIGKILGGFIALLGIGMFALPTGILGAGFVERIQKNKKSEKIKCPTCGSVIDIGK